MFYVKLIANVAVSATTDYLNNDTTQMETRNDWKTMERAEEVAAQLNAAAGFRQYVATDAGRNCSPRYDIIAVPQIGAEVSQYFNGDSYPEGVITKISASLKRVETSTGKVFFRKGTTGSWLCGGFGMIAGHRNDRNPSF